jgi:hypothetical protein
VPRSRPTREDQAASRANRRDKARKSTGAPAIVTLRIAEIYRSSRTGPVGNRCPMTTPAATISGCCSRRSALAGRPRSAWPAWPAPGRHGCPRTNSPA